MKISNIFFICIPIALLSIYGCGDKFREGYIINRNKNQVIWRTIDEGNGVREKVIEGADIKTFEVLKINDESFRLKSFAKDKKHVYWQGNIVKYADPDTFRKNGTNEYGEKIYKDDKQLFIFDGMLGLIPEKMATTAQTSEDDDKTEYTPVYIEVSGKNYDLFETKLKQIKIGDDANRVIIIMGPPIIDKMIIDGASKKRGLYYFLRKAKKDSIDKVRDFYYKFEFNNKGILTGIYQKLPTAPRFLNDEKHHEKETKIK